MNLKSKLDGLIETFRPYWETYQNWRDSLPFVPRYLVKLMQSLLYLVVAMATVAGIVYLLCIVLVNAPLPGMVLTVALIVYASSERDKAQERSVRQFESLLQEAFNTLMLYEWYCLKMGIYRRSKSNRRWLGFQRP